MKLTYRPEIDGLRAIAVGAVILYHAQITIFGHQPFKGGFIGVDIFFVISGYLITSIILKELVTTGSFSFKHFYERRIRRILPALLFVMLVSLPFAWMYLLPSSFVDFSKSILYSLGFSSNFYFHYSGQQYGAESGLLKPFLHTWSLSVEEQFYILFPIVLLVTFKYFRKHLIYILILGFFISLGLADWGSRNHPSFNFYVLPTRGWELFAGSILAYLEITNGKRSENKTLNLILPTLGLLLIGHSILFFNDEMFHPSFYTLLPIIGVCLIIWFSSKNELITKILSTKLFVAIGLISYSLYLWHYPIFSFARIKDNTISEYDKFEWIVLSIILSLISYLFVEKPFRNKKYKINNLIFILSVIIFIIISFNFSSIIKDGFKNRFLNELILSIDKIAPWMQLKDTNGDLCMDNIKTCEFFDKENRKIILFGDSHAGSLSFDLYKRLQNKNFNFIVNFKSCFNFIGLSYKNRFTKKEHVICNKKSAMKDKQFFNDIKNSIVIIGGRFPVYLSGLYFDNKEGFAELDGRNGSIKMDYSLNKSALENSFENFVYELIKNKNKIIIIYPIPEVGFSPASEIKKKINKKNIFMKKDNYLTTSYDVYKERTEISFKLFDSLIDKNIYRVYPHKVFCNTIIKKRCITHDNKNIFYNDNDHPSSKGAEMINNLIMKEIEKIELKSN